MSWLDWDRLRANADMLRFVQGLIHFRRSHAPFRAGHFWTLPNSTDHAPLAWHGVNPLSPDWRLDSHSLAFSLHCAEHDDMVYVACNAFWEPLEFHLPQMASGKQWHRVVDTNLPPPADLAERGAEMPLSGATYRVVPRSAIILLGR